MVFCLIEEEMRTHCKFLLARLISIDFLYKEYDILIACSDKTKEYILNFPLKYSGNISWLILENLDNNNIRYTKNFIISMNKAIELFGEALYVNCRIEIINKIPISDEIKIQGIGFVSRSVNYTKENIHLRYITDILYINDVKYLEIIDNLNRENNPEWDNYSVDNYSLEELRELNKKHCNYNIKIPALLKNNYKLDKFFPHETLISTEDFFAITNSINMTDITYKLEIPKHYVKQCDENPIDSTNIIVKSEEEKEEEKDMSLVNISCLNIRSSEVNKIIVDLNKELYSRMASYNIINMLLINIKYSSNKISFITPKQEGIGIWDRTDDVPGLYELIDMIIKDNEYFDKVEVNIDYFSFCNFIITDKPSYYWLNNTINKYSGIFICNYDDTLDKPLEKIDKSIQFGFYYSDYPKLLEEYSQKDTEKTRFCIEIQKNKIVEYELSDMQTSLHEKNIIMITSPEEKLKIIAESKFVFLDNIDVNQLANCFGLNVVPIFKKNCLDNLKDKNIYMLEYDKNYLFESDNWYSAINSREIILENNKIFYKENVVSNKIINLLLKKFLDICHDKFYN